jgi:hypothetical protein
MFHYVYIFSDLLLSDADYIIQFFGQSLGKVCSGMQTKAYSYKSLLQNKTLLLFHPFITFKSITFLIFNYTKHWKTGHPNTEHI